MGFTDAQLKGNWGEQYIASQLSRVNCLIRHVTQGHDSGIDLYCETLDISNSNKEPFLHFWCQVKTSKRWKGVRNQIKYKTDIKHIHYWLKQPIPVFIFLVPDFKNSSNIPFYIVFPLDYLFNKGDAIHTFRKIENIEDLEKFINNNLRKLTYIWELKDGKVAPLKSTNPQYTVSYPLGYSDKFEPKLKQNLRGTLTTLSRDIMLTSQFAQDKIKMVKPYILTLEKYISEINDQHYESYSVIATYYELCAEYKKAIDFLDQSIKIINDDINIDSSKDPWLSEKTKLIKKKQVIEAKLK